MMVTAAGLFILQVFLHAAFPEDATTLQQPARLLSGSSLKSALETRRSISVEGAPLKQVVFDIQQDTGIPVILDRRVDPSQKVSLTTGYVTVGECLQMLAESSAPEVNSLAMTDHGVVVGPINAVGRLRTLQEILRREIVSHRSAIPSSVYRSMSQPRQRSGSRASSPGFLFEEAAQECGLEVTNPETIPHDLWDAIQLPAMTFSEYAAWILNQYDLTFQINENSQLTISAVPATLEISEKHRIPSSHRAEILDRWQTEFPGLKMTVSGSTATVSATVEMHERLRTLIDGPAPNRVAAAGMQKRLFTMTVPRGTSFGQLVQSFRSSGIPIRIEGRTDDELIPLLLETVEFSFEKTPGDRFFPEVFRGWKARVAVREDEVVITFPATSE
ncbi:MAG: hypothetical protein R3C49_04190 [Planctomycetaceae bacterium]